VSVSSTATASEPTPPPAGTSKSVSKMSFSLDSDVLASAGWSPLEWSRVSSNSLSESDFFGESRSRLSSNSAVRIGCDFGPGLGVDGFGRLGGRFGVQVSSNSISSLPSPAAPAKCRCRRAAQVDAAGLALRALSSASVTSSPPHLQLENRRCCSIPAATCDSPAGVRSKSLLLSGSLTFGSCCSLTGPAPRSDSDSSNATNSGTSG